MALFTILVDFAQKSPNAMPPALKTSKADVIINIDQFQMVRGISNELIDGNDHEHNVLFLSRCMCDSSSPPSNGLNNLASRPLGVCESNAWTRRVQPICSLNGILERVDV